jgi:hypothetical protein
MEDSDGMVLATQGFMDSSWEKEIVGKIRLLRVVEPSPELGAVILFKHR